MFIRAIAQLVEQRTDIVYKLALCPQFDSWWHHLKRVTLRSDSFLFIRAIAQLVEQRTDIKVMSRSPPNQTAFATRSDCVRHSIRLRTRTMALGLPLTAISVTEEQ